MAFSAYNDRNNRPPPRNFQFPPRNYNSNRRDEPPEIEPPEPDPRFQPNAEMMRQSLEARREQQHELQVRRAIEERVRAEQDRTWEGIKQVGLDDSEEDEHAIAMAPVRSLLNPQLQPQPIQVIREVIYVTEKESKKKKHKKKSRKRSSSSSSSSESESRHKKKSKKKGKKRRHRHSDDDDDDSAQEGTSSQAKRPRIQQQEQPVVPLTNEFDAARNPWGMIRRGEYNYRPSHLVVDRRADRENLKYDQAYKHQVCDYWSVNKEGAAVHALSERFRELLSEPESFVMNREQRFFAAKYSRNWHVNVERTFRTLPVDLAGEDFIPLSHQARDADGEVKMEPPSDEMLLRMNVEDYEHYVRSQRTSLQESLGTNITNHYSVLQNQLNMNRRDVKVWLEFIDIQRPYFAFGESHDPDVPVKNEKAYFQRVMEVVAKALDANPSSADLQLKKLQLFEQQHGVTSPEAKAEWDRLENKLVNNVKMWAGSLKRRMNDRSTFKLDEMVSKIDKCLQKLVQMKYGLFKSHRYLDGTDEFLIDLLVTRFRLLIATGYMDRAIAMMQALTEFHFFRPERLDDPERAAKRVHVRAQYALDEFKAFWESGAKRIGEVGDAQGWSSYEEGDIDEGEAVLSEEDYLTNILQRYTNSEDREVDAYKAQHISLIEARRRLDRHKTKYFWEPVHFEHEEKPDLVQYSSRVVTFAEVKPILFLMDNRQLLCELVYKLLHLLGVPIPGLKFSSQEDCMRQLSPVALSYRPNRMKLEGFQRFVDDFISQLALSPLLDDPSKLYIGLATSISNSAFPSAEKCSKLKTLSRQFTAVKRQPEERRLEYLIILWSFIVDEMAQHGDTARALQGAMKLLHINLDAKNTSIWDVGVNVDGEPNNNTPNNRKKRLIYLRIAAFIVRHLPYSDEPVACDEASPKKKVKKEKGPAEFPLKTKREFLLSLWATGKITEIAASKQNIKAAHDRAIKRLNQGAPRDQAELKWRWIGNEHELVFELAALLFYELPRKNIRRFSYFNQDAPVFNSELAQSLQDSPAPQEMRVKVLQHIVQVYNGLEYSPGNLRQFIAQQVQLFPHSVALFKAFLEASDGFNLRSFLSMYPGSDDESRFIRDFGRLSVELAQLKEKLITNAGPLQQDNDLRVMLARFVHICQRIAEAHSDNLVPDDYAWIVLLHSMVDMKQHTTFTRIDEILALAQKVCPWSKSLLFLASSDRPSSEASFLINLNSLIQTHGLNKYCTDEEVRLLMTHQIV